MKSLRSSISVFALVALVLAMLCSCIGQASDGKDPWEDAVYKEDTVIGEGAITVYVEVKVNENSVTLTVNTDKNILGDALLENGIIEGEDGAYGIYIKKVNGILADYDIDASYWGFYKDGEYMMSGVDSTEIFGGEHYELVYTK